MSSEDVRTRLLHAAGLVFAGKGYQAATVREICLAADVNVASVNYYFGDKETLYVETVRRARQLRTEQFPMPDWPAGTPAELRLTDFITTMVYRIVAVEESSWNTRLMLREILEPTGVCRAMVEDYVRSLLNLLTDILSELLPESTPRHVRQKISFSIVGQCLYYRVADEVIAFLVPEDERREHFQPPQLAEHITRMCLAALGKVPTFRDAAAAETTAGAVPERPLPSLH